MAKISPTSIKYIIRARFKAEGTVEKPDVIGAIFGQTEGLLGDELELRELQKEGKIGRIEVQLEAAKGGSGTEGIIEIPTSMDKAETALIGAALETIERVGPSEANIKVEAIEDVRTSKREYVMERAKRLLQEFQAADSTEMTEEIVQKARAMNIIEYGRERLPAGKEIDESEEVIIVEGRADVVNLLKHGINNAIAMNGTSVPQAVIELCKNKTATLFVDGDRGGELITKDVLKNCELNYVARAPDGKEVEELTKKEILKALRDRVSAGSQRSLVSGERRAEGHGHEMRTPRIERSGDRSGDRSGISGRDREQDRRGTRMRHGDRNSDRNRYRDRDRDRRSEPRRESVVGAGTLKITSEEKEKLADLLDELIGTRGAYVLDKDLNILGKVPVSELYTILKNLKAHAIIADVTLTPQLAQAAELAGVSFIVTRDFDGRFSGNIKVLTQRDLAA